jgi:predicted aspartyl protease
LRVLISLYNSYLIIILGGILLFFSGDKTKLSQNLNPSLTGASLMNLSNPVHATRYSNPIKDFSAFSLLVSKPDTSSLTIPLIRIGRLFVIEATIDGETGNLIFDTGATNLVLNRTYFRDYIKTEEQSSVGITGGAGIVEKITANQLNVGELKFQGIPASLANLGHIENQRGIKVLGLFGFELIKKFEITIDIENNRLILNPIDKKGNLLNTSKQFKADYTQTVETAKNILFLDATVGGKNLRFCFDTGAESNALNSNLQNSILQTVSITRTSKLSGAGSASREVIFGRMNSFLFGESPINNMGTIITYTDYLSAAYGVQIDGVLGFDFVSKGNFCINFVKKQVGICFIAKSKA